MTCLKIIFFGTSPFAADILTFLLQNQIFPIAVVTRPDRPSGRGLKLHQPPVKQALSASKDAPPLFQPEKASTAEFAEQLAALRPDLFLVVAYGEIIKKNLLDIPRLGCVNVHASLLPKYRGAAPMQRVLLQGEVATGITIMEMNEKMDAGAIMAQESVAIPSEMTCGDLEKALCGLAGPLLLHVLKDLEKGKAKKEEQDHTQATFAPKFTPEEMQICWDTPATQVHNLIRALAPQPGAWCTIQIGEEKKRLKILRSAPHPTVHGDPGSILAMSEKEGLVVACKEGAVSLLEVQPEGKRVMSYKDFINGIRGKSLLFLK